MEISSDIHVYNYKTRPFKRKNIYKNSTGYPRLGLFPLFFYLVSSQLARHASGTSLLRRILGFGVPVGFWALFLKCKEPRFLSCASREL